MDVIKYNNGDSLKIVIEALKEGKLVVYPTDTLYGLAVNTENSEAIKKLFSVKNRSLDKPISVCFHDLKQLEDYVILTDKVRDIVKKLLPGPYTLLLNKKDNMSSLLTANTSVVGVRIPNHIVPYELTKEFPITSTSANISNVPTPDNVYEIKNQLKGDVSVYVDYGKLNSSKASTIIDLTKDKPIIIRRGTGDEKILEKIQKINL